MKNVRLFFLLLLSVPAFADNSLFENLTHSEKAPIFYRLIKDTLKAKLPEETALNYLFNSDNFVDRPSYNLVAIHSEWVAQLWYSIFTLVPGGRRPDIDISDIRYIEWRIPRAYDFTRCSVELMMTPANLDYPNNGRINVSVITLTLDKGTDYEQVIEIPYTEMKIFLLDLYRTRLERT